MTTPSAYLIGDSISLQYGPFLEAALLGRVAYHRKDGTAEAFLNLDDPRGANGGDSSMVLRFFDAWAAKPDHERHDLLMINCGLHDIKTGKEDGQVVIDPEAYRVNLKAILAVAPRLADRVAWISTTPVDDEKHAGRTTFGFHRYQRDVETYNGIAEKVMAAAGVPVVDLAGFTAGLGDDLHRDGVHFTEPVQRLQGAWLAGWILGALAARS